MFRPVPRAVSANARRTELFTSMLPVAMPVQPSCEAHATEELCKGVNGGPNGSQRFSAFVPASHAVLGPRDLAR